MLGLGVYNAGLVEFGKSSAPVNATSLCAKLWPTHAKAAITSAYILVITEASGSIGTSWKFTLAASCCLQKSFIIKITTQTTMPLKTSKSRLAKNMRDII